MAKRTIARFNTAGNIWPVVDAWAKERDYRVKASGDTWRRYQQGVGLMVAPKLIEVRQEDNTVEVQGWMKWDIWPGTVTIAEKDFGHGFLGTIPRSTGRRDMNILLAQFGQPPIA